MNQETKKAQEKPVLSAESFHRLLTAAYLLQVNHDRTPLQGIGAGQRSPFTAGAIVQKRTPSLLAGEPGHLASRSVPFVSPSDSDKSAGRIYPPCVSAQPMLGRGITGISIARDIAEGHHADTGHAVIPRSRGPKQSPNYSGWLRPLFGPIVPHAMKLFASRAMFLRAVEAITIATIFFALIGVLIRRPLLALPGRTSPLSEVPEQRSASPHTRPTVELVASSERPIVMRSSGQTLSAREADIVAEDVVVRYPKRVVNFPSQAAKKPALLAAETVVQYGPDVTVWSGNRTRRDGLGRLEH